MILEVGVSFLHRYSHGKGTQLDLHTSGREELFRDIVIKNNQNNLTPGAVRPLPGSMYMALFADVAIKKM